MPSPSDTSPPNRGECGECGASLTPDANYCSRCGTEVRDASKPPSCRSCGNALEVGDEYCTQCGASRFNARADTTDSAETGDTIDSTADASGGDADRAARRAFRRRIRQYVAEGWEIERDDGDRAVLVDRDIGSIPVHVVLLLLTGGVGNLAYGWYSYSKVAETRYLSIDDPHIPPPGDTASTVLHDNGASINSVVDWVVTLSSYGLTVVFAGLGFVFISTGQPVTIGLGLAFLAVGLYVAPVIHRRIERRHTLGSVGRKRTVDHRLIGFTERCSEPCVVCGERFDEGLVRRRRDETVVAGIPIRTHSMRFNHYCADCASVELFGTGSRAREKEQA